MLLTVLLALVCVFSTGKFLLQQQDKAAGNKTYEAALALAVSETKASRPVPSEQEPSPEPQWVVAPVEEDDPHIDTLEAIDLGALREVNPQVVGWILIPDTKINYPLMQGDDNDYYLNRTWDEEKNAMGSIFLECMNLPDLTNPNTIVYGHNMMDGSMFADIRKFRYQDFWETHPYVYILSDNGVYRYEIFSSYLAEIESNTYGLVFPTAGSWVSFLNQAILDSDIETEVVPEITDRVLTLSTCSAAGYDTRWVVHARLKMIQTG